MVTTQFFLNTKKANMGQPSFGFSIQSCLTLHEEMGWENSVEVAQFKPETLTKFKP